MFYLIFVLHFFDRSFLIRFTHWRVCFLFYFITYLFNFIHIMVSEALCRSDYEQPHINKVFKKILILLLVVVVVKMFCRGTGADDLGPRPRVSLRCSFHWWKIFTSCTSFTSTFPTICNPTLTEIVFPNVYEQLIWKWIKAVGQGGVYRTTFASDVVEDKYKAAENGNNEIKNAPFEEKVHSMFLHMQRLDISESRGGFVVFICNLKHHLYHLTT